MRIGGTLLVVFTLTPFAWAQETATLRGHDERTAAEAATVRAAVAERHYFVFPEHLPALDVQRRMSRRFFGRPEVAKHRIAHSPVFLDRCHGGKAPQDEATGTQVGDRSSAWPPALLEHFEAIRRQLETQFQESLPIRTDGAWHGTLLDGAEIYLVHWPLGPGYGRWSLAVHDGESGRVLVTEEDDATWCHTGTDTLSVPAVQQVDLDGDGRMEIAFPHHAHNGTVYDADWLQYLVQGKERLTSVLDLETKSWLSVVSHLDAGFLQTLLLHEGPLVLRVLVYYDCPAFSGPLVPIGEVWLSRKDTLSPYVVEMTKPWLTGAENYLELPGVPTKGSRRD